MRMDPNSILRVGGPPIYSGQVEWDVASWWKMTTVEDSGYSKVQIFRVKLNSVRVHGPITVHASARSGPAHWNYLSNLRLTLLIILLLKSLPIAYETVHSTPFTFPYTILRQTQTVGFIKRWRLIMKCQRMLYHYGRPPFWPKFTEKKFK